MKLHLGVIDHPYAYPQPAARKGKRKPKRSTPSITTFDVAEILEAKYHVMQNFFEVDKLFVMRALETGLAGTLEDLLQGAPTSGDPFASAGDDIGDRFKQWLSMGGMEKIGYPGVPTAAALAGVNHRFQHPYAKANKRRPSFIDTGQYQAAFKAWVD